MNTPTVTPIYGLRGENLERFHSCASLVDANIRREQLFDVRAETQFRLMRELLGFAVNVADAPYRNKINDCDTPADEEVAQAFVARASNRLALAIHIGSVG